MGTESNALNQIAVGTTINGDIISEGNIRIDGTVIGTLEHNGKLVVGPTGVIEGEISCKNADISGELKAKITVAELLTLKSSAKLSGDIVTGKLAVEPGAVFTGTCSMGAVVKDISLGKAGKSKEEERKASVGA